MAATKNKQKYERGCDNKVKQFFNIVMNETEGKCEYMYHLCSNTTWLAFTLEYDREFYLALGGEPTGYKKTVLNQYINLYVRCIKKTTTNQPLDASSQNQY